VMRPPPTVGAASRLNRADCIDGYALMGRSETPFRLGDALLLLLGGALLVGAVPFSIAAVSFLLDEQLKLVVRIGSFTMLGLIAYLLIVAGWHLFGEHWRAISKEFEDDYDGPSWPDVSVAEERRLRARRRWRRRRPPPA
jgi:hypothetical protein